MKPIILLFLFLGAVLACHAQQNVNPRYEVTIEAYVDGGSSLRFNKSEFYWHNGSAAKPGRHDAHSEATYVNGKEWMPKWRKNNQDRGEDTSDLYPWAHDSLDFSFELLAVTTERGQTGIEQRTPVEVRREGGEFAIHIPDPEPGARWYKFVVRYPDPLKPHASTSPASKPR